MAIVIHLEPQLQKCLNKLYKAGGRAALAAERVKTIIATLASHDGIRPAQVNKLTRHGEARIDKCKKFDLVGGYRLVYVREEQHYFFLFAGTHDDCDRWLNNHRNLKPELPCEDTPLIASQPDDVMPAPAQGVTEGDMDYDDILMKRCSPVSTLKMQKANPPDTVRLPHRTPRRIDLCGNPKIGANRVPIPSVLIIDECSKGM